MSEPIIYAWTNTGVFDTNDGTNYMINATANAVLTSFGNCVTIAANLFGAGNTSANVNISSNLIWVHLGNTTVNTWINSTAIVIGNSTVNVSINSTSFSGSASAGPSYVQNNDSRVLSGNIDFSGANVVFDTRITVGAQPGAAGNSVSANVTTLLAGNSTIFATVNSTIYSQTANNTLFVGSVAAGNVVSNGTSQTISGAKVWVNQQTYSLATVTDGTNIAWDVNAAQKGKVTLGGNRTMSAVSNSVEGATYTLWVIQDGTGSRTLAWTTTGTGSFDFGSLGAPTLTTTLNKADLLTFEAITIAGTLKLRFTGIMKGFG